MSITVRVHGWKAIAVLLVAAALGVFYQVRMRSTLSTEAVEKLRPFIVARVAGDALREMGGRSFEEMSPGERDALAARLPAADRVEIRSISAHGTGERVVVRAEVLVDGKPPPDGKTLRYYSMHYSTLMGWSFDQEVGALSYWLELF